MRAYIQELLRDSAFLAVVFVNWLLASVITDAASDSVGARKAVSLYITIVSLLVNSFSIFRSVSFLGKPDAPAESIAGLFAEIVNLTQVWGSMFASARYFSLPDRHAFYSQSLLHSVSESIFEMSLVQAGVGWASEAPVTVMERLVAWLAAYVGGVLCTNLFLISIVLGRRGYWQSVSTAEMPPVSMPTVKTKVPWTVTFR